jgi:hypothetical protein
MLPRESAEYVRARFVAHSETRANVTRIARGAQSPACVTRRLITVCLARSTRRLPAVGIASLAGGYTRSALGVARVFAGSLIAVGLACPAGVSGAGVALRPASFASSPGADTDARPDRQGRSRHARLWAQPDVEIELVVVCARLVTE